MMDDAGETTEQKAQSAFNREAKAQKIMDEEFGGKGFLAEDGTNVALGRNILREEIGYFGPWEGAQYKFDDEVRDRLIAHGRQDAATAMAMARSAFREAHLSRRVAVRATLLLIISIMLNVAALATLWLPG